MSGVSRFGPRAIQHVTNSHTVRYLKPIGLRGSSSVVTPFRKLSIGSSDLPAIRKSDLPAIRKVGHEAFEEIHNAFSSRSQLPPLLGVGSDSPSSLGDGRMRTAKEKTSKDEISLSRVAKEAGLGVPSSTPKKDRIGDFSHIEGGSNKEKAQGGASSEVSEAAEGEEADAYYETDMGYNEAMERISSGGRGQGVEDGEADVMGYNEAMERTSFGGRGQGVEEGGVIGDEAEVMDEAGARVVKGEEEAMDKAFETFESEAQRSPASGRKKADQSKEKPRLEIHKEALINFGKALAVYKVIDSSIEFAKQSDPVKEVTKTIMETTEYAKAVEEQMNIKNGITWDELNHNLRNENFRILTSFSGQLKNDINKSFLRLNSARDAINKTIVHESIVLERFKTAVNARNIVISILERQKESMTDREDLNEINQEIAKAKELLEGEKNDFQNQAKKMPKLEKRKRQVEGAIVSTSQKNLLVEQFQDKISKNYEQFQKETEKLRQLDAMFQDIGKILKQLKEDSAGIGPLWKDLHQKYPHLQPIYDKMIQKFGNIRMDQLPKPVAWFIEKSIGGKIAPADNVFKVMGFSPTDLIRVSLVIMSASYAASRMVNMVHQKDLEAVGSINSQNLIQAKAAVPIEEMMVEFSSEMFVAVLSIFAGKVIEKRVTILNPDNNSIIAKTAETNAPKAFAKAVFSKLMRLTAGQVPDRNPSKILSRSEVRTSEEVVANGILSNFEKSSKIEEHRKEVEDLCKEVEDLCK